MMTPKSRLFGTVLLFACFLLLTPLVQSCFNFFAMVDNGSGYAAMQISENQTSVCGFFGFPIPAFSPSPSSSASLAPSPSGGELIWIYNMDCNAGYAATFEVDANTFYGIVVYVRSGGILEFGASGDGGLWKICESGCTVAQCS